MKVTINQPERVTFTVEFRPDEIEQLGRELSGKISPAFDNAACEQVPLTWKLIRAIELRVAQ